MSTISFEQMAQLLSDVFGQIHPTPPPAWGDQAGFQGDPGAPAVIPQGPQRDTSGDPGAEIPASPGMRGAPLPGHEGDQFQPRNYAYGHMVNTITPEQAAAFRTLMFVQGHTGDTVGRGQVVPIPEATDHKMRAE